MKRRWRDGKGEEEVIIVWLRRCLMKLFARSMWRRRRAWRKDIDGGGCDYLAKMSLNCAMDHGWWSFWWWELVSPLHPTLWPNSIRAHQILTRRMSQTPTETGKNPSLVYLLFDLGASNSTSSFTFGPLLTCGRYKLAVKNFVRYDGESEEEQLLESIIDSCFL